MLLTVWGLTTAWVMQTPLVPTVVFAMEADGTAVLFIYLLRPHQVRGSGQSTLSGLPLAATGHLHKQ